MKSWRETVGINSKDTVIGCEQNISFVKMDIEGAELEALIGAKDIIKKFKPKMAISIYHKPEDIITLPSIIMEYCDDYRFMLRHYSSTLSETVLYAFH